MALTLPRTLTAGTPENVNHVQENFEAIRDFVNSAGVEEANIAAGAVTTDKLADDAVTNAKIATDAVTADSILAGSIGGPELGSLPGVYAYSSVDQSIPFNTVTARIFDSTYRNVDTMWAGANPTRVTIHTAGVYVVTASIVFPALASNQYVRATINLRVNGAAIISTNGSAGIDTNGIPEPIATSVVWPFNLNDYIEFEAYHANAGSTAAVVAASPLGMGAQLISKNI